MGASKKTKFSRINPGFIGAVAKTITIGVLIAYTRSGLEAGQNCFARALKEVGIKGTYDKQNAAGDIAAAEKFSEHLIMYISLKNAKRQGVEIPEEYLKKADRIFK